jgi:HD-GYP domain-containing protein (c-di-GMP phosphodiesterase class II)
MPKEKITLRVLEGSSAKEQAWQADQRLRVGRLATYEIVLNNASVSRNHAEVTRTQQGWVVRDLGSTNGTFLNGVQVGRAEMPLQEGDIVQFGEVSVLVDSIKEDLEEHSRKQDLGVEVVDTLNRSWEEITQETGAEERVDAGSLASVAMIGRSFYTLDSFDTYLENALWEVAERFDAQHAAFFLREEKGKSLAVRAVFSLGDKTRPENFSNLKLAEWAFRQEKTILCQPLQPVCADGMPSGVKATMLLGYLRANNRKLGILVLARGTSQAPFTRRDLCRAEALCHCLSPSIQSLEKQFSRQRDLLIQTLTALTHLLHLRNNCSAGYSDKVADYALLIAEELRVHEQDKYHLKIGAPLRDLGKIGIPDSILEKPTKLTPQEMYYVKSHVAKGVALLESIPFLLPLVPMVRSHHEHWDGSGYPDGIAGEQIPLLSRIVAVADALDAMTSTRPFRQPLCLEAAFVEIQSRAGSQFDPTCVQALFKVRTRIEEIFWERHRLPQTISWQKINDVRLDDLRPETDLRNRSMAAPA